MIKSLRQNNRYRYYIPIILLMVFILWYAIPIAGGYFGLGDIISEQLIERSGVTNSSLTLSTDGDGTSPTLGLGAICTTGVATNVGMTSSTFATLNGTVDNLNAMPRADVYFEWGYDANCNNGSTAPTVVTAVGSVSDTITGFDPMNDTVYFRIVTETDATYKGSVSSFKATSGSASGYRILWFGILFAIIAAIIFGILLHSGTNFTVLLVFVVMGILAYFLARSFLLIIWGG